jgi:hypothetical protein
METLRWKTRIAVLWVVAAISMSAHMILISIDPAAMTAIAKWAATAERGEWVFVTLFWLVPLWLAVASVTVKDSMNRWMNLVGAAILTALNVWHFFICGVPLFKGGPYAEPRLHHILAVASTVMATALIVWYAWKPPEQGA